MAFRDQQQRPQTNINNDRSPYDSNCVNTCLPTIEFTTKWNLLIPCQGPLNGRFRLNLREYGLANTGGRLVD